MVVSNILFFIPTWGNDPIWLLIFFRWVETTSSSVLAEEKPHGLRYSSPTVCGRRRGCFFFFPAANFWKVGSISNDPRKNLVDPCGCPKAKRTKNIWKWKMNISCWDFLPICRGVWLLVFKECDGCRFCFEFPVFILSWGGSYVVMIWVGSTCITFGEIPRRKTASETTSKRSIPFFYDELFG